jgi:TonB family protein
MRHHVRLLSLAVFCASGSVHAQSEQQISKPLGDTLTKALYTSSLIAPDSHPFHVKLHVHDAMNSDSALSADIEEYWASPTQWKRIVTAPGFSQSIVVNDKGTSFEANGDYFPIWLQSFVTALFDPIPNVVKWNKPDAQLEQTVYPSGKMSPPCLNGRMRVGDSISLSVGSSICFYDNGLLSTIDQPGYEMEFNEFLEYHDKRIPYLYLSQAIPGTVLVGKISQLDDLSKKQSFFSAPSDAKTDDPHLFVHVTQPNIEQMAGGTIHIAWPSVSGGKTNGMIVMFVSIDQVGRIREAYPVGTDNPRLAGAARDQLLQMQWKPAVVKGVPVQVDAVITLPFSTTLTPQVESAVKNNSIKVQTGVMAGRKMSGPPPKYPEVAREQHIQGSVYLRAIIGSDGTITKLGVIDAPSPILADAALNAVRQWRYTPYILNGSPTEVETQITVNFEFK